MDKLIEILSNKIGYTLGTILGIGLPGMLFVFVWNRDVYFGLGIIRLIILAFAISFAIYIFNFFSYATVVMVQEKVGDKESDATMPLIMPLFISNFEIYGGLLIKLENPTITIIQFVSAVIILGVVYACTWSIQSLCKSRRRKIR